MKAICFFTFFTLFPLWVAGQPSFIKKLVHDTIQNTATINQLATSSTGETSVLLSTKLNPLIVELSPEGELIQATRIRAPGTSVFKVMSFSRNDNFHVLYVYTNGQQNNSPVGRAIFVHNTVTNEVWGKKTALYSGANYLHRRAYITNDNQIIGRNYTSSPFALFSIQAENQAINWAHSIKPINMNFIPIITYVQSDNSNNVLVMYNGHLGNEVVDYKPYIVKLNSNGHVKESLFFHHPIDSLIHNTNIVIDQSDNIYIPLKGVDRETGDHYGIVIKMDSLLSPIWTKKISVESLSLDRLTLSQKDNTIGFAFSALDSISVINGRMTDDGDFLWAKGYDYSSRSAIFTSEQALILLKQRRINSPFLLFDETTIAKTSPNGDLLNCPPLPACVTIEDFLIDTTHLTCVVLPGSAPNNIDMITMPIDVSIEDSCEDTPSPTIDFLLPDTICQYTCLSPNELKNDLAHEVRWNIFAPSFDTTIVDSTFTWCFDEPGDYLIEQEIWFLGCAEIFPHQLTVLSNDSDLLLGDDIEICQQGEQLYTLSPMIDRPLVSLNWSTGATTPTIQVSETGIYSLTTSDGYCEMIDTIEVNFSLADIPPPYFKVPKDTLMCPDLLPFSFTPTSNYTDSFYIDNQIVTEVSLIEQGATTISAFINGCEVTQDIHLQVESCKIPIFLPNAFSPNYDGINDFVFPYGEDYEGRSLEVFDRWGNLVFKTNNTPFRWDGTNNGKKADTGVYIVAFTYINKRNLEEEIITSDVVLIR